MSEEQAPAVEDDLLLTLTDVPDCWVCGKPGLLLAEYAHQWTNGRGVPVRGLRTALLCPNCSRGSKPADELLSLFAVDEHLHMDNIDVFGELVAAWVDSVRRQKVDQALLAKQQELWHRGELSTTRP